MGKGRIGDETWVARWHGTSGVRVARVEAVPLCHGVSVRGEFAWSTMEGRKGLFLCLLVAAQLCVSSTQVLRIGKRNSCLRTALQSSDQTAHMSVPFSFCLRL